MRVLSMMMAAMTAVALVISDRAELRQETPLTLIERAAGARAIV
jgi:hypothetical protein